MGRRTLIERPYALAAASLALASIVICLLLGLALLQPERVIIGEPSQHDGVRGGPRRASCLDCHIPFTGTPSARCLSPGCHGALATGTPPREGKTMPIRFHAALRTVACTDCHVEHGSVARRQGFDHAIIPAKRRADCSRCHTALRVANHSQLSAVDCGLCHQTSAWSGVAMEHERVDRFHCDLCHVAPKTKAHTTVAGTCTPCHGIKSFQIPAK